MRVYTPEECARKADYYYHLWLRTENPELAKLYLRRMDMWDARSIFGFCAHE